MNPIAEEIESYLGSASMIDEEYLSHYGMPRRSGRYPWGSGEDPYQSSRDFLGRVEQMRKSGFTYTDENGKKWTGDNAIAKSLGYNSTDFRTVYAIAKDERRSDMVATAKRLRDKEGMNNSEIGRKMGINESSVRSLLDPNSESRMKQARDTAKFLKEQVDKKGMVDVGAGVNNDLKITKEKLDQALFILQAEGDYEVYGGRFSQVTNKGQMTTQRVLCKPGTPHSAIYDFDNVKTVTDYISRDDGKTYEKKFTYPESLDSKRLMIRYKEDGGIDRDGTVELRRNVPDLSLGESKYSQVRIMVDGKKYIKGMAVYKDDKDFPPGVDVIFNTNKSKSVPKLEVLKDVKPDPDNPFGSLIKDADQGGQYWYTDKNGKKKLGLINKRSDEGDWTEWKDALPSQFLSKQSKAMAEKQLGIAKADKQAEYEAIMALTNPTVKKYYLDKFASSCDSAAVHLKAAALPGQKYHVILPVTSLSEKEVYAPGYPDGSKLALVRYPHGGTFEIPICTVNNKNKDAIKMIGKDSIDAIGINSKVAERLSGADFDGDTVMCIPTHDRAGKVKIASRPPLEGLEGFDPKMNYQGEKKTGSDARNAIVEAAMGNPYSDLAKNIQKVTDATNGYKKIVDSVIKGNYGNGQPRFDKLAAEGYDWARVQNLVNERLGCSFRYTEELTTSQEDLNKEQEKTIKQILKMSDAELKKNGLTKEDVKALKELQKQSEKTGIPITDLINNIDQLSGKELLHGSVANMGNALINLFTEIHNAWQKVFDPVSAMTLYNIIANMHRITSKFLKFTEDNGDELTRTLAGLFALLDIIRQCLGGSLKFSIKAANAVLSVFGMNTLDLTADLGDLLVKFDKWLKKTDPFTQGFTKVGEVIKFIIEQFRKLKKYLDTIPEFQAFTAELDSFKKSLKGLSFEDVLKNFEKFVTYFESKLPKGMKNVGKNVISGFKNGLSSGKTEIPKILSNIGIRLLKAIKKVLGIHSPSKEMEKVGEYTLSGLWNGLTTGKDRIVNFFKNLGSDMLDELQKIDWNNIVAGGIGVLMISKAGLK